MKIIQLVTSRQFRGAEIFALQLSRNLKAMDVTVQWVALYAPHGKELTLPDIDWLELTGNKKSRFDWRLITRLRKTLQDFKPDIVQANAGDTLKYAVLVKRIFRMDYKIVFRNASMVSLYIKSWVHRGLYARLYSHVDRVISVSEHSRNDFVKTFPRMVGRVAVIPNGLDTLHLPTRLKEFDSSAFNIVHVAGFSFEKNHLAMLRIFKLIQNQIPSAKLWLVGDGPLKTNIEKQIENMNLRNVHLTGSVVNPLDYISSASVLVLPSIIEGLPGVILEAMYCRTPVVAYDVGGISEVVKPGETGWLVKSGDEAAFAKSVMEVFDADKQVLNQVKDNAYEMVLNHFDNRVIAQRFLEVYNNL